MHSPFSFTDSHYTSNQRKTFIIFGFTICESGHKLGQAFLALRGDAFKEIIVSKRWKYDLRGDAFKA